ncbi:MAG: adenine phosphoribosyltransferase [Alphaproteobacteria bacterium]|nr:adenine phosphoribosyltransferase [Alphaproteobacteria bacterium]
MTPEEILTHIRNIPNFPKQGILFKDITTAIQKPEVFHAIIDNMYDKVKNLEFDYIAAIESRGYLFGAPLAYKMNKGLVLIRKPGKLPAKVVRQEYSLEYGTDALEMHEDAIARGQKVLLIDDLLATGGTVKAAAGLIDQVGGKVTGGLFLLELKALSSQANLPFSVYSLIKC